MNVIFACLYFWLLAIGLAMVAAAPWIEMPEPN
jgi:hypothetical protein